LGGVCLGVFWGIVWLLSYPEVRGLILVLTIIIAAPVVAFALVITLAAIASALVAIWPY
jgi:hypothetical protein